jgi:hypothetical protein
MKKDKRLSRRIPASGVHDHKQPQWWLAPLSPFLTYINTRTLALLMFVGFAVLNTTHGNDGETKEQVTGNIETQVIANRQHDLAQAATPPTNYTTPASAILWQFLSNIVNGFVQAFNDPALIKYAMEQGADTSGSMTTVCQDPTDQSQTSSGTTSAH